MTRKVALSPILIIFPASGYHTFHDDTKQV